MPIAQMLIDEMDQEAVSARRCLERVPQDQLGWKPHEKSLTLGQLAHHIAQNPAVISQMLLEDGQALEDFPEDRYPPPESAASLLTTLDESLAAARAVLTGMSDEDFTVPWSLTGGGRELLEHDQGWPGPGDPPEPLVPPQGPVGGLPENAGHPSAVHVRPHG